MYMEKIDVCTWKRQMYVHGKDRCGVHGKDR